MVSSPVFDPPGSAAEALPADDAAREEREDRRPPGERALLERVRTGDRQAFGELVALHQRSVYGLALRLARNPDDARDLAQEAFVRAWAARERLDPTRPFAPWVLTITRRLGVDRLRYQGRWKQQGLPEPGEPSAPPPQLVDGPRAHAAVEQAQLGDALSRALSELSEHYRAVIELHHVQGLPVAEIATILGRPPGTIMTWLYRARAALKDHLQQEGITP
ncbi:MAG: RNA polymerase sigma factor [Deltaproteobacteria bacterium]|nr:RNA polymerase sigma factor [Deltaproteobacteria bacterium]